MGRKFAVPGLAALARSKWKKNKKKDSKEAEDQQVSVQANPLQLEKETITKRKSKRASFRNFLTKSFRDKPRQRTDTGESQSVAEEAVIDHDSEDFEEENVESQVPEISTKQEEMDNEVELQQESSVNANLLEDGAESEEVLPQSQSDERDGQELELDENEQEREGGEETAGQELEAILEDSDCSDEEENDDENQVDKVEERDETEKDERQMATPSFLPKSTVVAVHAFRPSKETDISLQIGDQVEVLESYEDGWVRGRVRSSSGGNEQVVEGEFPATFVRERDPVLESAVIDALLAGMGDAKITQKKLKKMKEKRKMKNFLLDIGKALEAQKPLCEAVRVV